MITVLARVNVDSESIKNLFFDNLDMYDVRGDLDELEFVKLKRFL